MAAFRCIKQPGGTHCEGYVVFEETDAAHEEHRSAICPQCHTEYELVRTDDGWELEVATTAG